MSDNQFDKDDFLMKPLTSGLGFHKKPVSLKDNFRKSRVVENEFSKELPHAAAELTEEASHKGRSSQDIVRELMDSLTPLSQKRSDDKIISPTLPRAGEMKAHPEIEVPQEAPVKRPNPLDRVNFEIPRKDISEGVDTGVRRGAHDALIKPLVPISFSLSSAILDSIIIFALSLLFLISLLMVTGIDAVTIFASAQTELTAQVALVVMYLAVMQMYVVISRSFFGSTVGEWTFDLQLGDEGQIAKAHYPVLVLWRSLIITVTGFIVLPFLSLILGRDLTAKLTALQLYKKNI